MMYEPAIDPAQPILDAHHHLYDRPGLRYLVDEYLDDLKSGHAVCASVFVQARAAYHADGPEHLRPVGETKFARESARQATARGMSGLAAAIVGYADLMLGDAVRPVLDAHIAAGDGHLRGIRHITAWDQDAALLNPAYPTSEAMMDSKQFQEGLMHLAALDLSFDAWVYHPQLSRLAAFARKFPDNRIIIDHCGGIARTGRYAGYNGEIFSHWSRGLHELATCPNVMIKVSGLGMPICGFGFDRAGERPSSIELAEAWRPWVEECIEAFGTDRVMFASNFPPDKVSYDYAVGWNAMKRIVAGFDAAQKNALFWQNAAAFYRVAPDLFERGPS